MDKQGLQVAIDGPASAGKSTVAKIVAQRFHYIYCDTGAMYRAITWKALQAGVALDDEAAVKDLLDQITIRFEPGTPVQKVFVDDTEVTLAIRQPDVTNAVSQISAQSGVRTELTERQRQIADAGGIVMDGRDIGSTVLPKAEVKIFLVASVEERAQRRLKDNAAKGINTPLETLKYEIEERDRKDSTRKISPLTQAADAIRLDTTSMSIQEVADRIAKIIQEKESL
ncbi:(d)CMP kinase [Levilactobacillus parabrevis]|uniref:(d)CMP kinase n=1 Tax=Levilactobacillus parabrevis TaxID=357278 RepID=UPI0021A2887D|nr:(d)CMP kinase [Levilactobacillus parabrevis]MCT4488866.1 (d)CMP kinase [Levilactobacillus parabrevis]MCT4489074.1 (d)CMP kinase [Levilactobacillus parabrevis]